MHTKIIIDADPGVDDSIAILTALRSPELEVLGMTAIFGNTNVETTAQNCLRLLELEGHTHVPVAMGSGCPLVIPMPPLGTHVHGVDGMGGTYPPPPKGSLLEIPAAQFLVETIKRYPGEVTLVPIGPLTNIALALLIDPKISRLVKEVIIMGGAATVPGNISPVAEANIFHDPHAAEIVFKAGWPVTMVGLDVTTKVVMDEEYLKGLFLHSNPATQWLQKILPHYIDYFDHFYGTKGKIHTHDPSAIAYLLDRTLFTAEKFPLYVEKEGMCMGQTILDRHNQWDDLPMINVCLDVEPRGVLNLIKDRLTR